MFAPNTDCIPLRAGWDPARVLAWDDGIRARLEALIQAGAGRGLPVVFDFDNTICRGDIGEATMAALANAEILKPSTLPEWLCPALQLNGQRRCEIQACADVVEYYHALLTPTVHGPRDPSPYANAYAWAVAIMSGLTVAEVLQATRAVIARAQLPEPQPIEVRAGGSVVSTPELYPEMVEFLAELIRHEFDVWIVSASNVWSVRCMVLEALNPLLQARGAAAGIRPDHVIGISTLLRDARDHQFKDAILVKENAGYAQFAPAVTAKLRLTAHFQFPLPTYSGKLACVFDAIGRRPYLCAGDGPGDSAMMAISEHQLWITPQASARLQPISARLVRSAIPAE